MNTLLMLGTALLVGCAPKTAPTLTPENQLPSSIAITQIDMKSGDHIDVQNRLSDRLTQSLVRNGYSVKEVSAGDLPSDFDRRRLPTHKAQAIAQNGDNLVVLVEAVARFYSQLRGQYRWEVSVEMTVLDPSNPERTLVDEFTVPVFLRFQHEKEAEAVVAAGIEIERHLQRLLDDVATLSRP